MAVLPETVTAPATVVVPGPVKVKVVAVIVEASIAKLNVALTTVLRATAVAISAGTVDTTVGAAGGGGGGGVDPPPPQPATSRLKTAKSGRENRRVRPLIVGATSPVACAPRLENFIVASKALPRSIFSLIPHRFLANRAGS